MVNIIGRFYFKKTSNGNLLGEFSHNLSNQLDTESAVKKSGSINSFVGKYTTSWSETNSKNPVTIDITHKLGSSNSIYTLIWSEKGKIIFRGEGMLCDDILIGDYRDF